MTAPSLVGYALDEAKEILAKMGFKVGQVHVTKALGRRGRASEGDVLSEMRVVRQRLLPSGEVELVVCERRSRSLPMTSF